MQQINRYGRRSHNGTSNQSETTISQMTIDTRVAADIQMKDSVSCERVGAPSALYCCGSTAYTTYCKLYTVNSVQ